MEGANVLYKTVYTCLYCVYLPPLVYYMFHVGSGMVCLICFLGSAQPTLYIKGLSGPPAGIYHRDPGLTLHSRTWDMTLDEEVLVLIFRGALRHMQMIQYWPPTTTSLTSPYQGN